METIEYRRKVASYLQEAIGGSILEEIRNGPHLNDSHDYEGELVQVEKRMQIESGLYSPRCDIAVGPFAFTRRHSDFYNSLLEHPQIRTFLDRLLSRSENRTFGEVEDFIRNCRTQNRNPRAFMVVEVEGSSCRNGKLILGSMVNASIMGQVGIIVPYRENTAQSVHAYIDEMGDRRKTPRIFSNLIVIKKEVLDEIMAHPH